MSQCLLDLWMKEYICQHHSQNIAEGLVENGVEYATKKQKKTTKFCMGVPIAQDSQDCVSPHVSGNIIIIKNYFAFCFRRRRVLLNENYKHINKNDYFFI